MSQEQQQYPGPERRRGGVFVTEVNEAQIALLVEEEVERRVSKME